MCQRSCPISHQAEKTRVVANGPTGSPLVQTAHFSISTASSGSTGAPNNAAATPITTPATQTPTSSSSAPKVDFLGGLENDPFGNTKGWVMVWGDCDDVIVGRRLCDGMGRLMVWGGGWVMVWGGSWVIRFNCYVHVSLF